MIVAYDTYGNNLVLLFVERVSTMDVMDILMFDRPIFRFRCFVSAREFVIGLNDSVVDVVYDGTIYRVVIGGGYRFARTETRSVTISKIHRGVNVVSLRRALFV